MRVMQDHMRNSTGSRRDGGALVYLIETGAGSIFFQDTSGCWSGTLADLHADVAILAASGRPNHNGDPYQGSMAGFLTMEAELLGATTVVLGHHDNWGGAPAFSPLDTSPFQRELGARLPSARLIEPGYLEATPLLA